MLATIHAEEICLTMPVKLPQKLNKSAKLWLVDRTWASSAGLWNGSERSEHYTEQKKESLLLQCSIYLAILYCLWRENSWQERLQGSVCMYSILASVFMWLAVINASVAKGCKSAHILLQAFFQNPSQNDLLDEKTVDTEADK